MARIGRRQQQALNERILKAALRRFPPGNTAGVFGLELGPRVCKGLESAEQSVRVYVQYKDPALPALRPLAVRFAGKSRTIPVDVIATGAAPRAADAPLVHFSGLHPGAAIQIKHRFGGVGLIVTHDSRPTHFVTAGHLFAHGELDVSVRAARRRGPARIVGRLVCNLLDQRPAGLGHAIDAALVELNEFGRDLVETTDDARAPAPEELLGVADAVGERVQAFRPTAHDYSDSSALKHAASWTFTSSARPGGFTVRDVLRTTHEITHRGDSGTLLVTADRRRLAVGTCVGVDGRATFLEPLERALAYLSAVVPDLRPWER